MDVVDSYFSKQTWRPEKGKTNVWQFRCLLRVPWRIHLPQDFSKLFLFQWDDSSDFIRYLIPGFPDKVKRRRHVNSQILSSTWHPWRQEKIDQTTCLLRMPIVVRTCFRTKYRIDKCIVNLPLKGIKHLSFQNKSVNQSLAPVWVQKSSGVGGNMDWCCVVCFSLSGISSSKNHNFPLNLSQALFLKLHDSKFKH